MSDPNLITTYTFQGRQFLVKMNVINKCLELILTDKQTGEEWECSYDVSYIENLTRKTGNFKQFEIFTTMLKSGLLKTASCIELDLLTCEDLDAMRPRRTKSYSSTRLFQNNNRRYLILTYSVEFDRINYPLPLEYCGPPDPIILQKTVRQLEADLFKAEEELNSKSNSNEMRKLKVLEKRIDELVEENNILHEEIRYLTNMVIKTPKNQSHSFQRAISQIEKNLNSERKSHHKLLEKLHNEKLHLINQVQNLKQSERSLKSKLQSIVEQSRSHEQTYKHKYLMKSKSCEPNVNTIYQRRISPATRKSKRNQLQRSRSISPQVLYDDHRQNTPIGRQLINQEKLRSRSSSASSRRHGFVNSSEATPIATPVHSRKQSPCSGRSPIKQFHSEATHRFTKRAIPTKISRSASPTLQRLEKTVNSLFPNYNSKRC